MAESDTRLETLEDEVRVLKGEVKRTLVDLRALLMREDSPLGEKALRRRSPNSVAEAPDESMAASTEDEELEEVTCGVDGIAPEGLLPGPDFNLPMADLPSGPPQAGPGPVPGLLGDDAPAQHDSQTENAGPMADQLHTKPSDGVAGLEDFSNHHAELEAKEVSPPQKTEHSHDSPNLNGREHPAQGEEGQPSMTSAQGNRISSVYDEYRELLEETKQTHPIEDEPVGPPLDINLLSNLVYWTALAKQRVGEEQLKDILQLYIQSGHSRPELQDLLLQVSRMVDADPPAVREGPREWVDLVFHLHGILTGGFPVIKVPQIRLSPPGEAEVDQG